jgi:hypothetical protein
MAIDDLWERAELDADLEDTAGSDLRVGLESRGSCGGRMGFEGGKIRDMIELCILTCCECVRLLIVPESF